MSNAGDSNETSRHGMSSAHASSVKRAGHLRENIFSNQFTNSSMQQINGDQNYSGASSDCVIDREDYAYIKNKLGVPSGSTSIKGGKNYQFHLGQLPEIEDKNTLKIWESPDPKRNNPDKVKTCWSSSVTVEEKKQALGRYDFWKKYLGKGDILAIWPNDQSDFWVFFSMKDVLNLMITPNKVEWKFLETGRIKGYCKFANGKSKSTVTFEYRKGKGFTLGANSNAGHLKFYPWLLENIKSEKVRRIHL